MEGNVEAIASWNAFDDTTTMSVEESEFIMTQLLGSYPFSVDRDHDLVDLAMPSTYWSGHAADSSTDYSTYQDVFSYSNSDVTVGGTCFFAPPSDQHQTYCECEPDVVPAISAEQEATVAEGAMGAPPRLDQKRQMKRNFSVDEYSDKPIGDGQKLKKAKISPQVKNPKSKKTKKSNKNGDEGESNVVEANVQGSISCNTEEDESNASQEEASGGERDGAALNLNGKTRASRGSATDPQSLYARKRRERINERLRILQNLIPNGTKVDISTMLEEAVQYVKFLQLQIKLLSSDKLWMYAPLAYNGMDVGLDMKISLPNQ